MKNIKIAVGATVILLAIILNFSIISKASTFTSSLFNATQTRNEVIVPSEKPIIQINENDHAIQVALLLDTSSSMSGLIEQAKSQLWKIVGELSRMKKDDSTPTLQIALYEYGNDRLSASRGYIKQVSPLTTDMDLISEKLFALTTNGGSEYCGHVIQTSLQELEWVKNSGSLKMIYVAGNESFAQGGVPFQTAIGNAVEKGIVVNTIFCGAHEQGIEMLWKTGAMAGKGEYMSINQNQATVYIPTPYDQKISDLNQQLNKTYIHYGDEGKKFKDNQVRQDSNAGSYSQANVADRAAFKSSKSYSNADWDVVDAYKKDKKILQEKKKELPTELQNLSEEEVEVKIIKMTKERETIQVQIRELDKERRAFIEAENVGNVQSDNLENSMLKSLRKNAQQNGFKVD